MQTWQVHCGDALTVLKTLPDRSVDCVCTSPPYFGLRDYQTGTWEGGEADCQHIAKRAEYGADETDRVTAGPLRGGAQPHDRWDVQYRGVCGSCGARRVDRQVGLDDSPQAYVSSLVAIFAECRRVLKDQGTMWINLGDSYASQGGERSYGSYDGGTGRGPATSRICPNSVKPKDLIGIPWSVAFALRSDGWYLRSEIIWHKKSCMPESVKDRPTKAHEQVFLLTKQPTYFYDADAIREKYAESTIALGTGKVTGRGINREAAKQPNGGAQRSNSGGFPREYGDEIDDGQMLISEDMERFPQFETYDGEGQKDYAAAGVQNPSAVKRRILTRSGGGKWSDPEKLGQQYGLKQVTGNQNASCFGDNVLGANARSVWSLGPEPATDIDHFAVMPKTLARRCILAGCPFGGTVLDPFAGSGTTGIVALEEGRSFVGIELNPSYHAIARQRLGNTAPLLAQEIVDAP